jgi:hypothetical protein
VGRTAVLLHERVAAVVLTGRLLEMASLLEKAASHKLTTLALQLHIATKARPRWHKKQLGDETATRLIATFIMKLKATIPTSLDPAQEYGLNASKLPSKRALML